MDKTSKKLIIIGAGLVIGSIAVLNLFILIDSLVRALSYAEMYWIAPIIEMIVFVIPMCLWIATLVLACKWPTHKTIAIWAIVMGSITVLLTEFLFATFSTDFQIIIIVPITFILFTGSIMAIVGGSFVLKQV